MSVAIGLRSAEYSFIFLYDAEYLFVSAPAEMLIQFGTFLLPDPPGGCGGCGGAGGANKTGGGGGTDGTAQQQQQEQLDEQALYDFVVTAVRQPCGHKLLDSLWRWVGGRGCVCVWGGVPWMGLHS